MIYDLFCMYFENLTYRVDFDWLVITLIQLVSLF